ncbi:hypothetical protein ACUOA8_59180, partial [Escherichia sp. SS-MK2]
SVMSLTKLSLNTRMIGFMSDQMLETLQKGFLCNDLIGKNDVDYARKFLADIWGFWIFQIGGR